MKIEAAPRPHSGTARILVALGEDEVRKQVYRTLTRRIEEKVDPVHALSREEAVHRIEEESEPFDLLITDLCLPESLDDDLVDDDADHGLEVVRCLRAANADCHAFVLTPAMAAPNRQVEIDNAFAELSHCTAIRKTPDFIEVLANHCVHSLARRQPVDTEKCLEIEIDLSDEWPRYKMKGVNFPFGYDRPASVNDDFWNWVEKLTLCSQNLELSRSRWEVWKKNLRDISDNLRKYVYQDWHFQGQLMEGVNLAGGNVRHTRLRFVINVEKLPNRPARWPILWEALPYITEEEPWMLAAPVFRRVIPADSDRRTLFDVEEAAKTRFRRNCLIICSEATGEVEDLLTEAGEPLHLGRLDNIEREASTLQTTLNHHCEDLKIGTVEVLKRERGEAGFYERVKRTIKSRPWHMVHYAGHSHFDKSKDTGYLFFEDRAGLHKVTIDVFCGWLDEGGDTRFVFLSSCDSSTQDFVFQLARYRIPEVVGFRWDIDDRLAAEYSEFFYRKLCSTRSIAKAFAEARRDMYDKHRQHHIWASPMLVSQMT